MKTYYQFKRTNGARIRIDAIVKSKTQPLNIDQVVVDEDLPSGNIEYDPISKQLIWYIYIYAATQVDEEAVLLAVIEDLGVSRKTIADQNIIAK